MRRLMTALGVTAIMLLAGNAAYASFVFGDYYFPFCNWDNSGAAFGSGGWNATTDGAIWLKSGSSYVLDTTVDVNAELDFRTASNQPWTVITNTLLLSNGSATGDVSYCGPLGYPGMWSPVVGFDPSATQDPSPYAMPSSGMGFYYLPAQAPSTNYQFDLYFWTGQYPSYAAAAAAGANVAHSGAFAVGSMASGISFPSNSAFINMPSMILQPVPSPEPSTMLLAATGLLGLLAYAWRRRK